MSLPLLLPEQHSELAEQEWQPSRFLSGPQPPPADDVKLNELEMLANARQLDGKLIIKKTRPRRTVDYNGGMGRWELVRMVGILLRVANCTVAQITPESFIRSPSAPESAVHRGCK